MNCMRAEVSRDLEVISSQTGVAYDVMMNAVIDHNKIKKYPRK